MARRTIKFIRKPDNEKINPNSLRKLLIDIINNRFGNKTVAAKELSKHVDRYAKSKITEKFITENLQKDEQYIHYWHLEAFAENLGIPTGLLLIYSRLRANMEAGKTGENSAIINGLIEVLNNFDTNDNLDFDTLEKWADIFGKNRVQGRLPLRHEK